MACLNLKPSDANFCCFKTFLGENSCISELFKSYQQSSVQKLMQFAIVLRGKSHSFVSSNLQVPVSDLSELRIKRESGLKPELSP
jgi:hypothetical protein